MAEDGPLERGHGRSGLDAELLVEHGAQARVAAQGVGLGPRPVPRHHELAPEALLVGVLRHQALELGDELPVAAQGQVGVDPVPEGHQMGGVQAGDLGAGERQLLQPAQGGSPPQVEGAAQHGPDPGDLLGAFPGAPLRHELGELGDVDCAPAPSSS